MERSHDRHRLAGSRGRVPRQRLPRGLRPAGRHPAQSEREGYKVGENGVRGIWIVLSKMQRLPNNVLINFHAFRKGFYA